MSDLINKVEVVNLFRPTSAHISCTKSSRSNHGISWKCFKITPPSIKKFKVKLVTHVQIIFLSICLLFFYLFDSNVHPRV
jgi:hypothetical protein